MPFMLYDVTAGPSSRSYKLVRIIKVAGKNGPLAKIQRTLNPACDIPFWWHAKAAEIVTALHNGITGQEIVIDLRPNAATNVSLFRLLDIWGFSVAEWTTLALRLECLFVDLKNPDPDEFKKVFDDANADRTQVGEFLYLQGGVQGGTWNWGMIGRVNGALLWPDAFEYLATELGRAIRA